MRELIGKPVRVEWRNPAHDWPAFVLLAWEPPMVHLRGRSDPGHGEHDGDEFWVHADEIVTVREDHDGR